MMTTTRSFSLKSKMCGTHNGMVVGVGVNRNRPRGDLGSGISNQVLNTALTHNL